MEKKNRKGSTKKKKMKKGVVDEHGMVKVDMA